MQHKKHLTIFTSKGFSVPVIIILLAIALLGIGIGVKFFLNSQAPVTVQDVTPEVVQPIVVVEPPTPQATPTPLVSPEPVKLPLVKPTPSTSVTPVVTPIKTTTTPKSKVLAFALASAGSQNATQIGALLDKTAIDGVALQIGWPTIETSDEVFDWSVLDAALKAAKDRNKYLTIHVFSGAGLKVAPWMKAAGMQTYTLTDFQGRTHEEIIPWDGTYLSQYTQFLKSLAAHLSGSGYSSTVARLSVAVPVAEMDLIACRNNMLAGTSPYNRAIYLTSWKTMIDAYGSALPSYKKLVSAPVGLICFPDRDTQFFTDVMNYASEKYGTSFAPFAADLTSEGSDRMKSYASIVARQGSGYQTIWSATNDASHRMKGTFPGNLLQAVCKAKTDGADYIEIYGVDVLNTDSTIQKGIKAVHDASLCS